MDVSRRGFLGALTALPVIGGLFAEKAAAEMWPVTQWLMVRLPQPKDRPVYNPAGIGYWIERPIAGPVLFTHVGDGFYAADFEGVHYRAIMERLEDGHLFCSMMTPNQPGFRNRTTMYSAIDKQEVLDRMKECSRLTKFSPPLQRVPAI